MNKFIYHDEADFIPSLRFRLACKMEKTPGIIEADGCEYHVNVDGRFLENTPPFVDTFHQLTLHLVKSSNDKAKK